MRAIRTTIISILAVGLLAGSAVGVVAQDEEGSSFTIRFEQTEAPSSDDGGLERLIYAAEASDPRASGVMTSIASRGGVFGQPVSYFVNREGVRLVNDGGAWVGTLTSVGVFDETDETGAPSDALMLEMSGEGGYAGHSMFVWSVPDGLLGIILPTDSVPTQPEPPAA